MNWGKILLLGVLLLTGCSSDSTQLSNSFPVIPRPSVTAAAEATVTPTPIPTATATPVPKITLNYVEPSIGPIAGGTALTLVGSGFATGVTVAIGDKECASPTVISPSKMTCTTTSNTVGLYSAKISLGISIAALPNAFRYSDTPVIQSVNPASGAINGGLSITLVGGNFAPGATVKIGTGYCTDVNIVSSALLQCKTPQALLVGIVDVSIKNSDGSEGILPRSFQYIPASSSDGGVSISSSPLIAAIVPAEGPQAGGTAIHIIGANFNLGATPTVGGLACTSVSVISTSDIACTTPASSRPGRATVLVVNTDGSAGLLANAFTYNSVPLITNITPVRGPIAGGTLVTIHGSGFRSGATITIGGVACTGVVVAAYDTIRCTSGAVGAGAATVTLTNSDASSTSLPNGFTYDGAPTVTSVSPNSGSQAGGAWVSISGTGFQGSTGVLIGGSPCLSPLVMSASLIQCVLPSSATTGAKDVQVSNVDAQSGSLSNGFTYTAPPVAAASAPVVLAVSPRFGPPAGGTTITLTGLNFVAGDTVKLGSATCGTVNVTSATSLQCVTPLVGLTGAVPIIVSHSDGSFSAVTIDFLYSYAPGINAASPAVLLLSGGERVTLSGSHFMAGASVMIGGQACTGVTLVSEETLQCSAPATTAGSKDVVVLNPDLQTATLVGGVTYRAPVPTVTGVSPGNGPASGGTTLTLTGTGFQNGLTITLNSRSCGGVIVGSATNATCASPALPGGTNANLVLTNPDAQSTSYAQAFLANPPPAIAAVIPARGPITGSTAITLQGSGFVSGSTVTLGGTACTGIQVVSAAIIRCTTPAHVLGSVNIVVTLPDNQSTTLTGGFLYDAAPTISGVAPATGGVGGGNTILVEGTGFQSGALVKIGGNLCTSIEFQSSTSIACAVPRGAVVAQVNVDVTNPDGQTVTATNGYRYTPQLLGLICNGLTGDYISALSTKPCTETNPETGTLSWSISGCGSVTINSTTGVLGGNLPAIACTPTITLTNINATIGLSESLSRTITIAPYLNLAFTTAPILDENCSLTVPGTSTTAGGATWSAGVGSTISKATVTAGSAAGISGTLTDFTLGSFTGTWASQCTGPAGSAANVTKNMTLATGTTPYLTSTAASANYFVTQNVGRESNRLGCGSICDRPTYGSISVGGSHVCALADNGAHCWGRGDFGQTGANAYPAAPVTSPALVYTSGSTTSGSNASGASFTSLAYSRIDATPWRSFCGILSDKTVACYGDNQNGQLGVGHTTTWWHPLRVSGLTNVTRLVALYSAYCALRTDGTVWCWGWGSNGRLGDGNNVTRTTPVRVANLTNVTDIGASQWAHTCAVASGQVWCWGYNSIGQLGDGTFTDRWEPVMVPGITTATKVRVGANHSCALLADGSVKCWGQGTEGQLGDGTGVNRLVPVTVTGASITGTEITDLAAATTSTCATGGGKVWCWGTGGNGETGDGNALQRNSAVRNIAFGADLTKPLAVKLVSGVYGFCAITDAADNYSMWCWGYEGNAGVVYSQFGTGTNLPIRSTPVFITNNVAEISISMFGTPTWYGLGSLIKRDGQVWSWGHSEEDAHYSTPTLSRFGTNQAIATGVNHSCAMLSSGRLRCWGYNSYGELGVADTALRNVPTGNNNIAYTVAIDGGMHHTCYLTSATALAGSVQKVMCTGRNNYGQLGDTTLIDKNAPVAASLGAETGLLIATGWNHACVATDAAGTKKIRCWGYNSSGQLGDNTINNNSTPQIVLKTGATTLTDDIRMLAAGGEHTCALISDGTVRCWGNNTYGQLGDGTTVNKGVATLVPSLSNIVAISAGHTHTCALTKDTKMYCWGSNISGNLGDGTTTQRSLPTLVVQDVLGNPLNRIVAMDAGWNTTCALVEEANDATSVRCWGDGSYGQMGNGTTTAINVLPVTANAPTGTAWTRTRSCRSYTVTAP